MSRENPAKLQTLGMHEQHLPQRHDRIHAQWREGDFIRPHHIVGDGKLDGCKSIESDRYGAAFTAEHLGEFFLCLNQLGETLLGYAVARRSTGCDIGSDFLQTGSYVQLLERYGFARQKIVLREGTLSLDPNLSRDPFAAPEIGTITVLQLNSQLTGVGVLTLQLAFHEHQRFFELFHGDQLMYLARLREQPLEISFKNSNRRHVEPREPLSWNESDQDCR